MDSFFKAAVCDLDKVLDDFELNAGEVLKEVEFNSHYKMNNVERILINVMYCDSLIWSLDIIHKLCMGIMEGSNVLKKKITVIVIDQFFFTLAKIWVWNEL